MHLVAIHSLGSHKESLADSLSAVLEVTPFEALKRLRGPGDGPMTVAVFAQEAPAAQLCLRLQAAGFPALLLTAEEIEAESRARVMKHFNLGEHELAATAASGESFCVAYQDIAAMLRGTSISTDSATETSTDRSLSLGRAALSGGLMITKTTKTVREITTEERQGFLNLYAPGAPTLVFRENVLVYDSLGTERRPSRAANFIYLVAELRRRCPEARYDERLLNRAGQAVLLGPSLDPQRYLHVATALLAKVVRGSQ